jgi:hypothetical protein
MIGCRIDRIYDQKRLAGYLVTKINKLFEIQLKTFIRVQLTQTRRLLILLDSIRYY